MEQPGYQSQSRGYWTHGARVTRLRDLFHNGSWMREVSQPALCVRQWRNQGVEGEGIGPGRSRRGAQNSPTKNISRLTNSKATVIKFAESGLIQQPTTKTFAIYGCQLIQVLVISLQGILQGSRGGGCDPQWGAQFIASGPGANNPSHATGVDVRRWLHDYGEQEGSDALL